MTASATEQATISAAGSAQLPAAAAGLAQPARNRHMTHIRAPDTGTLTLTGMRAVRRTGTPAVAKTWGCRVAYGRPVLPRSFATPVRTVTASRGFLKRAPHRSTT